MLKYLFPRIEWSDIPPMFFAGIVGALIAGIYGILHDQITYSIGPEYFTKFKFKQFHYADFGWDTRWFVATIGFLATWWVGLIIGWFIARRLIPNQPNRVAFRQIANSFGIVFISAILSGFLGYLYGNWLGPDADYRNWTAILERLDITEHWAFIRVGYIHNASYLGGLIGLIMALILIKPRVKPNTNASDFD